MQPARLGSFRIGVTVPALEERHQAPLLRAIKTCLVHNTLLGQPSIEVVLRSHPAYHPATIGSGMTNFEARN